MRRKIVAVKTNNAPTKTAIQVNVGYTHPYPLHPTPAFHRGQIGTASRTFNPLAWGAYNSIRLAGNLQFLENIDMTPRAENEEFVFQDEENVIEFDKTARENGNVAKAVRQAAQAHQQAQKANVIDLDDYRAAKAVRMKTTTFKPGIAANDASMDPESAERERFSDELRVLNHKISEAKQVRKSIEESYVDHEDKLLSLGKSPTVVSMRQYRDEHAVDTSRVAGNSAGEKAVVLSEDELKKLVAATVQNELASKGVSPSEHPQTLRQFFLSAGLELIGGHKVALLFEGTRLLLGKYADMPVTDFLKLMVSRTAPSDPVIISKPQYEDTQ